MFTIRNVVLLNRNLSTRWLPSTPGSSSTASRASELLTDGNSAMMHDVKGKSHDIKMMVKNTTTRNMYKLALDLPGEEENLCIDIPPDMGNNVSM